MAAALKQLNAWKAFGGMVYKYSHASTSVAAEMKLSVFVPPEASKDKPVPALYWLSGLTCTEDNFAHKAGAFRAAAQHNVAIICPDTSPRGVLDGEAKDGWDFGVGASFYVNATTQRWAKHYRMYDYVTKELPAFIRAHFPVSDRQSIFGHSMGGHGALICHLKNPGLYASCSAFSPICHPSVVPWGLKAFSGYLGDEKNDWKQWDATELLLAKAAAGAAAGAAPAGGAAPAAAAGAGAAAASTAPILVDQGSADEFLAKGQLTPEHLTEAAKKAGVEVQLNMRDGYDHSYYFISTFVDSHIAHHAKYLHANAKAK